MKTPIILAICFWAGFIAQANASEPMSLDSMPVVGDSIITMTDSIPDSAMNANVAPKNPYKFKPLQLVVPVTLIGVGFIGLESDWLKFQNTETRDELQEHPHSQLTVDDFTQFAPLAATYGLKLCGVRSLHGYADMTIIAGTAYLLTGISVYVIKNLTKVERPDGSSRDSSVCITTVIG